MIKYIDLPYNADPVTLIQKESIFVLKFILTLHITESLPFEHLINYLAKTYQTLVDFNSTKQYEIIVDCKGGDWKRHKYVALGGRFDSMHCGHYLLLTYACLVKDPS